jgi:hypothetical protein
LSNNSGNETLEIAGKTNLTLGISASKSNLMVGDSVAVNLDLENIGQYAAEQLTLTLTSDSALGYTSFTGTDWSCTNSGTATTCTSASLSSAGTAQLALNFLANSERAVANITAEVTTDNTDFDLTNNTANTTLRIADQRLSDLWRDYEEQYKECILITYPMIKYNTSLFIE